MIEGASGSYLHEFTCQMTTYSAKDDEDAESLLLHSYDWMNSQGIAEDTKCGRFCLTLVGDAHFGYKLVTPVGNDWSHLQRLFQRYFSKL